MNPLLKKIIVCPKCNEPKSLNFEFERAICNSCEFSYKIKKDILLLINSKREDDLDNRPPKKPGTGSYWRRQNWEFNHNIAKKLSSSDIVLEVGCGRGYFKPLFGKNYIGTDITIRKEVDFVADLIDSKCIRDKSIDVLVLNNVLEHVYNYKTLLINCSNALKKSGKVIITVPYSSVLHQTPDDYFRFSHYALEKICFEAGLDIIEFKAVFNPFDNMSRSFKLLKNSIHGGFRNKVAKLALNFSKKAFRLSKLASKNVFPAGQISIKENQDIYTALNTFNSPLGYHIEAVKN